jgi:UPF0716 protein FxsA
VRYILLLFFVIPLLELYLLVVVGGEIGAWPTVAFMLVMALLGGILAKREGLKVWRAWREALEQMRPPEQGVIDGVLVLVGGALLIAPGMITDVIGFMFLIPFTRRIAARHLRRLVDRKIVEGKLRVVTLDGSGVSGVRTRVVETTGESLGVDARGAGDVVETSGESVGAPELTGRGKGESPTR